MTNQHIGVGQLRSHTIGFLDRVTVGNTLGIIRRDKLIAYIVAATNHPS